MKKKKVFNIVSIPFKIVLVLLMAYGIYEYFDNVFAVKNVDRAETFHNFPAESLDAVVLGSSHAQYSFIPSVFYDETGLYSIVMGSACQPLEVSYQMLREILKTQKPSFVILETYTAMPLREICEADVCYVKAQYMMTGEEKYNTINYLPHEKAISYYNEFINNHNNWRYISSLDDFKIDVKKGIDLSHVDSSMGYIEQFPELPVENYWYSNYYDEYDDVKLDDLDLESLNNIFELCKDNDIQLILYKTPIDGIDQNNYNYLNQVWKWCSENGIPYIDMIALQDEIDFRMVSHSDSYHCNIVGANTITTKISDYIKENYLNKNYVTNHSDNGDIDKIYEHDLDGKALHVFEFDRNVYRALSRIKNANLTLIVKYKPGLQMESRLKDTLIDLGVSEKFDLEKEYFAIIKNGELLVDSFDETPIQINVDGKDLYIDSDDIYIGEESMGAKGNLSIGLAYNNLDGFYVKNIDINGYPWELGYDYFIKNN